MNSIELLNLSEPDYRALPGINWSSLKHMAISPAQYKWVADHPQVETAAKGLGKVEHIAMLMPDEYLGRVRISSANRGTKGFEKDENRPEHEGCILVTAAEKEMIDTHLLRYRANRHHEQITKDAHVEQCLQWTDEETGLVCKCRPDMFNDLVLAELKTSRLISENAWWWDFKNRKYHGQIAFYHDALMLLDGKKRACLPIKLETQPCFDVVYYEPLENEAIEAGRNMYRRYLNELRDCIEVDAWPGKSNELYPVQFDRWD